MSFQRTPTISFHLRRISMLFHFLHVQTGRLATVPLILLLLTASVNASQADQVAGAEKQQKKDATQKENAAPDLATLMGGPHLDPAAVERGRKIFIPTCGFCHGNDAHGKSGPDLVRSASVLHDNKGDVIGPAIQNGRPER